MQMIGHCLMVFYVVTLFKTMCIRVTQLGILGPLKEQYVGPQTHFYLPLLKRLYFQCGLFVCLYACKQETILMNVVSGAKKECHQF